MSEGRQLVQPHKAQYFCVMARLSGVYALAAYFSAVNNPGTLVKLFKNRSTISRASGESGASLPR